MLYDDGVYVEICKDGLYRIAAWDVGTENDKIEENAGKWKRWTFGQFCEYWNDVCEKKDGYRPWTWVDDWKKACDVR